MNRNVERKRRIVSEIFSVLSYRTSVGKKPTLLNPIFRETKNNGIFSTGLETSQCLYAYVVPKWHLESKMFVSFLVKPNMIPKKD